jgi:hypothetical protein
MSQHPKQYILPDDLESSPNILNFRSHYDEDGYSKGSASLSYFHDEKYKNLREYFLKDKYNLLNVAVGAGDVTGNIQKLHTFDIFVCMAQGDEYVNMLRDENEYINKHFPGQKLICVLNLDSKMELKEFEDIFTNRVAYLDFDDALYRDFVKCKDVLFSGGKPDLNFYLMLELMSTPEGRTVVETYKSAPSFPPGRIAIGTIGSKVRTLYGNSSSNLIEGEMLKYTQAGYICNQVESTLALRTRGRNAPPWKLYECIPREYINSGGGIKKRYTRRRRSVRRRRQN